jgi:hypothetical protein
MLIFTAHLAVPKKSSHYLNPTILSFEDIILLLTFFDEETEDQES